MSVGSMCSEGSITAVGCGIELQDGRVDVLPEHGRSRAAFLA